MPPAALLVIVALPAVESWRKAVWPAVAPATEVPLLLILALLAVEVSKKFVLLTLKLPRLLAVLVKVVRLPAVALFVNAIVPALPALSLAVTKFCVIPELLVIP